MKLDKMVFESLGDEDIIMAVNILGSKIEYLINFEFTLPVKAGLLERIKKAWSVLANGSEPIQEVMLTREQALKLKEFISF